MAVSVQYCDRCGIRIEPKDIKAKRILIDGDKIYCRACVAKMPSIEGPAKKKAGRRRSGKKKARPDKPSRVRKATGRGPSVKKKSATAATRRPRPAMRAREREEEEDWAPGGPAQKKSPLPIILGACGVVVVIIIVALLAGGGGDRPNRDRDTTDSFGEQPPPPPTERPRRRTGRIEPSAPVERRPSTSSAMRKYEEATRYAQDYHRDYDKIVEMLEAIMKEEEMGAALSEKIQDTITLWMGRWETAVDEEWEKRFDESKELASRFKYEDAARLFDEFPEKLRKFGTYDEMCTNEKNAFSLFGQIKDDLERAQGEFSASEVEEAEKLFWKIRGFAEKYTDNEVFIEKLNPILKQLWAQIEPYKDE